MKIIYVGKWIRRGQFCSDEFKVAKALESSGHEVVRHNFRPGVIADAPADLVLWSKCGRLRPTDLRAWQQHFNCPHVCWHWDATDRPGWEWFWQLVPMFDMICNPEAGFHEKYEAEHGTPWRYLPPACDPDYLSLEGEAKWPCDVGFIGRPAPGRTELLRALAKHYSVQTWGGGWAQYGIKDMGDVYGKDIAHACASAKIMIGHSYKCWCYGAWSDRLYHVLGSAGFFLTQDTPGLADAFAPGVHLATYHGLMIDDCVEQVRYWLDRPDERAAIAARGMVHARIYHTWGVRVRKLIEHLKGAGLA